jgi:hypothetical protein
MCPIRLAGGLNGRLGGRRERSRRYYGLSSSSGVGSTGSSTVAPSALSGTAAAGPLPVRRLVRRAGSPGTLAPDTSSASLASRNTASLPAPGRPASPLYQSGWLMPPAASRTWVRAWSRLISPLPFRSEMSSSGALSLSGPGSTGSSWASVSPPSARPTRPPSARPSPSPGTALDFERTFCFLPVTSGPDGPGPCSTARTSPACTGAFREAMSSRMASA